VRSTATCGVMSAGRMSADNVASAALTRRSTWYFTESTSHRERAQVYQQGNKGKGNGGERDEKLFLTVFRFPSPYRSSIGSTSIDQRTRFASGNVSSAGIQPCRKRCRGA